MEPRTAPVPDVALADGDGATRRGTELGVTEGNAPAEPDADGVVDVEGSGSGVSENEEVGVALPENVDVDDIDDDAPGESDAVGVTVAAGVGRNELPVQLY
jgi:hypothetical protein